MPNDTGTSSLRLREGDLKGECYRLNRRLDLIDSLIAQGLTGTATVSQALSSLINQPPHGSSPVEPPAPPVTGLSGVADYTAANILRLTPAFTLPTPMDNFGKAHMWAKTPAGQWIDFGYAALSGDLCYTSSDGPAVLETWNLYAVSVTIHGVENAFDRGSPGSTPTCTISVPARPGVGPDPGPDALLVITSLTFDYSPAVNARDRFLQLHVTYNVLSGSLDGVSIFYRTGTNPVYNYVADYQATTPPQTINILNLTPPAAPINYTIVLCAFRNGQFIDAAHGVTSTIAVTTVPNPTAGREKAEIVTPFASQPFVTVQTYFYDSSGVYKARLKVQFVAPVDLRWSGVDVVKLAFNAAHSARLYDDQPLASFSKSPGTIEVTVPSVVESWDVAFISYDGNGDRNTYQAGITPQNTIAIGSASGTFDLRRYDPASSLLFDFDGSGKLILKTGAALTQDPTTGRLSVTVNGVTNDLLARTGAQKIVIINGDLAANSVLANNIVSGSVSSRHLDATEIFVGGGGNKPGRLGVYDQFGNVVGFIGSQGFRTGFVVCTPAGTAGLFFFTTVDYVSGSVFGIDMFNLPMTISGNSSFTVTNVFEVPARVTVISSVGFATTGAYSTTGKNGAWFQTVGIGGFNMLTPALSCDAAGNLDILDGTFKLTRFEPDNEQYQVKINSAFTAITGAHTFTGVQIVRLSSSSHRSVLINRGLVAFSPTGQRVAACVSYNGDQTGGNGGSFYGDLWVADQNGTIVCEMSGANGMTYSRHGYQTESAQSQSGTLLVRTGWTGYIFATQNSFGFSFNQATRTWDLLDVQGFTYMYIDNGIITDVRASTRIT